MTNRLLKIKYNSFAVIILFIQPIYALWLLSLGNYTSKLLNRNDILNKVSAVYMALVWTVVFVVSQIKSLRHSEIHDFTFNILFPLTFVCWIYSSIFVAKATIDFENKDNDYMTSFRDYLPRFFIIFYWFFGIWYLQKKINTTYQVPSDNSDL